jgi:hypothetical protein
MKNLLVVAMVLVVVSVAATAEAGWVVPPRVATAYYPVAPVVVAPAPVVIAPAPVVVPRPVVVARPVVVPAPVVYGRPVIVRPRVYVPGQPVRNAVRFALP